MMLTPVAFGLMIGIADGAPARGSLRHQAGGRGRPDASWRAPWLLRVQHLDVRASASGCCVRFVYGCGVGITTAPVTESIMGSLPRSRAGVGSAVNDTTRQTGGAVGVAVIGSLFAARYHAQIGSLSFLPAGVRQAARESIGTSLTEAAKQPAGAAQHLIDAAHAAFLSSMRLTYTVLGAGHRHGHRGGLQVAPGRARPPPPSAPNLARRSPARTAPGDGRRRRWRCRAWPALGRKVLA